jgi:hypothetical protein
VLAVIARDEWRDRAGRRIEQHDAELVVGDENAPVFMYAQPVRFAVVFRDDIEFALRRDAENAAVRNVDDIEIAGAIERGPFEKAAGGNSASTGGDALRRHVALAQVLRHGGEDFGFDELRRGEHVGVLVNRSHDYMRVRVPNIMKRVMRCHDFGSGLEESPAA